MRAPCVPLGACIDPLIGRSPTATTFTPASWCIISINSEQAEALTPSESYDDILCGEWRVVVWSRIKSGSKTPKSLSGNPTAASIKVESERL